jgi:hypothetical protein
MHAPLNKRALTTLETWDVKKKEKRKFPQNSPNSFPHTSVTAVHSRELVARHLSLYGLNLL